MQGETFQWMRIAHNNGWSLTETKKRISSTEFNLWNAYFDKLLNIQTKQDHYLAQLACEMRRSFSSNPKTIKPEHFKISFTKRKSKKVLTEAQKEAYIQNSKMGWMALAGVGREVKKE